MHVAQQQGLQELYGTRVEFLFLNMDDGNCALRLQILFLKWSEIVYDRRRAVDLSITAASAERFALLRDAHLLMSMLQLAKRDDVACLYVVWCSWRNGISEDRRLACISTHKSALQAMHHQRIR